jgi:hypothetical protein
VHWHFAYFFVTSANNTVIVAIVTRVRCMSAIVTVIVGLFLNRKRAKKNRDGGLPMSLAQCIFLERRSYDPALLKKARILLGIPILQERPNRRASLHKKKAAAHRLANFHSL